MPRQEEFKDRLFSLLREYNVEMEEMEVVTTIVGYTEVVDGINFFSNPVYDDNGVKIHDMIDLTIGTWENVK